MENEFIRFLKLRCRSRHPVLVGIGDDAAVLNRGQLSEVIATDLLLDGVHFELSSGMFELIGRKALAVNLSDIAAMGATPEAAFVSLAIPGKNQPADPLWLNRIYDGLIQLADRFAVTVAGGDTNSWDGPFAINVCVTGSLAQDTAVLRSGAKAGDHVYVSGPLGGSLPSGRHLTFEPRLDASSWLMKNVRVHSMMDISDGLATDAPRLAEASGVRLILDAASIPLHVETAEATPAARLDAALCDGEDFELLLTVPEAECERLANAPEPLRFFRIGIVCEGQGVFLQLDDRHVPLLKSGWQHRF